MCVRGGVCGSRTARVHGFRRGRRLFDSIHVAYPGLGVAPPTGGGGHELKLTGVVAHDACSCSGADPATCASSTAYPGFLRSPSAHTRRSTTTNRPTIATTYK